MSNSPPSIISIVTADDHAAFRSTVYAIVANAGDVRILAEAWDGNSALEAIQKHRPDVAVLDLGMPGLNGLELTRLLREKMTSTAVVLLTMHTEPHIIRFAVEAGASAYVLKDEADEYLVEAIRAVGGGGTFFSPRVRSSLAVG